jgi:UDP-2-acetamido-2,6-beta-L-arabino-hexul-4-ose reductase
LKKIGITGQNGFIGYHLWHTLRISTGDYELIPFEKSYFDNPDRLDEFTRSCDVIVHLAALNRHQDEQVIYDVNTLLPQLLVDSFERTGAVPHVLISSSTQEERGNLYGNSKKRGREILANWAGRSGGKFTGLMIPNVFGPFCKPNYNSVVATFCHQIVQEQLPVIHVDAALRLIYVGKLVKTIIDIIAGGISGFAYEIEATDELTVSKLLEKLQIFDTVYRIKGQIPECTGQFDIDLFNTYRSYLDVEKIYPRKYVQHADDRGVFVELIRLEQGGQVSFSTTNPGVVRGNHFHTRKIERFSVVKGKAVIELRKIGTDKVHSFEILGEASGFVDMPVWYTHNIRNTGTEILYTVFWINEFFNPEDTDTFIEAV